MVSGFFFVWASFPPVEFTAMKRIYINSRLQHIVINSDTLPEREWLWSQGQPWLLLNADRLNRLMDRLGEDDSRIKRLFDALVKEVIDDEDKDELIYGEDGIEWPEDVEITVLVLVEKDRRLDREARDWLREEFPEDFDPKGNLNPFWRMNRDPRFDNDEWEDAVNRIILGQKYRNVAEAFGCSVGHLHDMVQRYKMKKLRGI